MRGEYDLVTPTTVRLTTDPAELAQVDASLGLIRYRKSQRAATFLGITSGSFYLFAGLAEFMRTSGGFSRASGFFFLLAGLAQFALAGAFSSGRLRCREGSTTDTEVTITDAGLSFRPSSRDVSWGNMSVVRNVGAYLVFVGTDLARCAAIRKTEFADEGRLLWHELDDRFVPKRYLVRDALSSVRISFSDDASRRVRG